MGVMACSRTGCERILCDKILPATGEYICGRCWCELSEAWEARDKTGGETNGDAAAFVVRFMQTSRAAAHAAKQADDIEDEFDRLVGRGKHNPERD